MANASTIYALSSGLGPSGVAVIRVSGPEAPKALEALLKHGELAAMAPYRA